jgi:hypothetical protein
MKGIAGVPASDCEVAIIGAGVVGLAAAGMLCRAGKAVRCLDATNRIGGRILTVHDPLSPVAIEVGAEFVHGCPPEIFDVIKNGALTAVELERNDGKDFLPKSLGRKDVSFESYISRSRYPPAAKNWARRYVEGFNAARSEVISLASLKQDADAAGKIDGDRSFRLPGGYDQVHLELICSIRDVQMNSLGTSQMAARLGRGSVSIGSGWSSCEAAMPAGDYHGFTGRFAGGGDSV